MPLRSRKAEEMIQGTAHDGMGWLLTEIFTRAGMRVGDEHIC